VCDFSIAPVMKQIKTGIIWLVGPGKILPAVSQMKAHENI